uniref:Phospholipid/glycerol acyltransferase domain-containing protein n=1 Tax=Paramormyrops kingsleyae TaxID=1676925 RepID=A0A3B3Q9B0_9TELE
MGIIQRSAVRACPHVWFERSEMKDRHLVAKRLRDHVADKAKLPILIFPEGTCINNTSVMMFKKGSFEIGGTIYPVAIKYDPQFGDAFWNSGKYNMVSYLLRMMTSWAIVCNVWYLPPMQRQVGTWGATGRSTTPTLLLPRDHIYCALRYRVLLLTCICLMLELRNSAPPECFLLSSSFATRFIFLQEGEDAVHFASRVKAAIAHQGGLVDLSWDGGLKRAKVKDTYREQEQKKYSSMIVGDGSSRIVGDDSSRIVGDGSSRIVGDDSSRIVGDDSSMIVGDDSSRIVGDDSSRIVGDDSSRIVGDDSSMIVGDDSSMIVGDDSSRIVGDDSSTIVGDGSSRIVGDDSSTIVGDGSSRIVGDDSSMIVGNDSSS